MKGVWVWCHMGAVSCGCGVMWVLCSVRSVFYILLPSDFKDKLKTSFDTVNEHRPQSTRKESAEMYLVAKGYKQQTT